MQLYNTGVFLCLQDSLAAEIEGTMRRELSVEEESAFQEQRYWIIIKNRLVRIS